MAVLVAAILLVAAIGISAKWWLPVAQEAFRSGALRVAQGDRGHGADAGHAVAHREGDALLLLAAVGVEHQVAEPGPVGGGKSSLVNALSAGYVSDVDPLPATGSNWIAIFNCRPSTTRASPAA